MRLILGIRQTPDGIIISLFEMYPPSSLGKSVYFYTHAHVFIYILLRIKQRSNWLQAVGDSVRLLLYTRHCACVKEKKKNQLIEFETNGRMSTGRTTAGLIIIFTEEPDANNRREDLNEDRPSIAHVVYKYVMYLIYIRYS